MRTPRAATGITAALALALSGCGPALPPSSAASGTGTSAPLTSAAAAAGSGAAVGGFGVDYFTAPANRLNLTLTADAASAVAVQVTAAGGTVSATGPDGTSYRLEVPADALAEPTLITLTPITRVDGWPEAPGDSAAVEMQPDGLELAKPARLVITPAKPIGDAVGSPFGFYADGKDAHLILPERGGDGIAIPVEHFSGQGFVWHVNESFWLALERYRQDQTEDRLQHRLADQLSRLRAQEKAGLVGSPSLGEIMQEIKAELERDVLNRRLQRASASCKDAKHALGGFVQWNRQMELLGMPGEKIDPPPNLRDLVRYVCAEEATKLCFETGDIGRLASVLQADAKSLALLGENTGGLTARYLDACARFDLQISHNTRNVIGVGGQKFEMEANIDVKVPLRWKPSDPSGLIGLLEGEAPGAINDANGVAGTCDMTIKPGGADAPYKVEVKQLDFIRTGPEMTTIRFQEMQLTLKEGHFSASGSIKCRGVRAVPFPRLDLPFVFWDNPPEAMTGWKGEGHPTIASKDFTRDRNSFGMAAKEKLSMKLVHTPGQMPPRPVSP